LARASYLQSITLRPLAIDTNITILDGEQVGSDLFVIMGFSAISIIFRIVAARRDPYLFSGIGLRGFIILQICRITPASTNLNIRNSCADHGSHSSPTSKVSSRLSPKATAAKDALSIFGKKAD